MSNKAKQKEILDDYAHREIPSAEIITKLVEKESDRGVILICVAYLEEILGALISSACVSNSLADTLLQIRKPAGDFEGRILLAQALGLIHEEEFKGLRTLQKIKKQSCTL